MPGAPAAAPCWQSTQVGCRPQRGQLDFLATVLGVPAATH
jgi:hypothetical protein